MKRDYTAQDVVKLRGSVQIEHTLARRGAERLWRDLTSGDGFVRTFGALTGAQAVNMVKGGLKALYLSGWQVAGDANLASQTYPDQSLYPSNSVPAVVKRSEAAQQRSHARRPDPVPERQHGHRLLRAHRGGRRGRIRRRHPRLRADALDDRGRARPASTTRTSCPPPRSAATWAARCLFPPTCSSTP